jgi:hypothetical protein
MATEGGGQARTGVYGVKALWSPQDQGVSEKILWKCGNIQIFEDTNRNSMNDENN